MFNQSKLSTVYKELFSFCCTQVSKLSLSLVGKNAKIRLNRSSSVFICHHGSLPQGTGQGVDGTSIITDHRHDKQQQRETEKDYTEKNTVI